MEFSTDLRYEANLAARLFLELASEHSLEGALQKFVATVGERPDLACVQIWCIGEGDRCSHCHLRERCADNSRCLHLTAGRGISVAGVSGAAPYFADPHARIPLGLGLLGDITSSLKLVLLQDMAAPGREILGIDWIRQEQIRSFGASPIVFKGEVLGVLAGYSRQDVPEDVQPWISIVTEHVATVIANARAFEEIQRLKVQPQPSHSKSLSSNELRE